MHEAVRESVELAREIRFSMEKVRTTVLPSLAVEARDTLENLVRSSIEIAHFLSEIQDSDDALFSFERFETSTIAEIIDRAWSCFQERDEQHHRTCTLTIQAQDSKSLSAPPIIPKTIIPCLEQLFRATADSLATEQATIVLEYAVADASTLAPRLLTDHPNSPSVILFVVRAPTAYLLAISSPLRPNRWLLR